MLLRTLPGKCNKRKKNWISYFSIFLQSRTYTKSLYLISNKWDSNEIPLEHLIQQKEVDKFIFIYVDVKQWSEDDKRSFLCRLMLNEEIKRNHNSALLFCSVVRGLIHNFDNLHSTSSQHKCSYHWSSLRRSRSINCHIVVFRSRSGRELY